MSAMCHARSHFCETQKAGSAMSTETDANTAPPNACQLALARELVACLGRESAIHACKVNGWEGVLDVLLAEAPCGTASI